MSRRPRNGKAKTQAASQQGRDASWTRTTVFDVTASSMGARFPQGTGAGMLMNGAWVASFNDDVDGSDREAPEAPPPGRINPSGPSISNTPVPRRGS